ncbi:MAG TPA: CmcJ/NvfI family oxidoreductase [Sphingomicrobium sp.]
MSAFSPVLPAVTTAPIEFLRPMRERPVSYQYDPPAGIPVRNGKYDPHMVDIRNARPLEPALSLDEEGFTLVRAQSDFSDFHDDAAIRSAYYPEVERLIATATGAERVIGFDHNIRNIERAEKGEAGIRGPVPRAHNDFTLRSGPDRVRAELELRDLDAKALLRRRFAIINLWRPINRPAYKSPLALCDARTVAPADLVATDLVYRDRIGETYAVQHNPAQQWYYFPNLSPTEAILLKGYDSDERVTRFTAHAAFDDPHSPLDAPERESIEIRALAIYPLAA